MGGGVGGDVADVTAFATVELMVVHSSGATVVLVDREGRAVIALGVVAAATVVGGAAIVVAGLIVVGAGTTAELAGTVVGSFGLDLSAVVESALVTRVVGGPSGGFSTSLGTTDPMPTSALNAVPPILAFRKRTPRLRHGWLIGVQYFSS